MSNNDMSQTPSEAMRQEFIQAFERTALEINTIAREKGWWSERERALKALDAAGMGDYGAKILISQCIVLAHSELSEGIEGLRHDLQDDKCPQYPMVVVEMADCIIRLMDLAHHEKWPLAEAIVAKMKMNSGREFRHGGKAF